jgi:hypothetical protein
VCLFSYPGLILEIRTLYRSGVEFSNSPGLHITFSIVPGQEKPFDITAPVRRSRKQCFFLLKFGLLRVLVILIVLATSVQFQGERPTIF